MIEHDFALLRDYSSDMAIEKVIEKEKGYVDDPKDSGGETNLGITIYVAQKFKHLWEKYDWDGDMRTMPKAFAEEVYKIRYWDSLELDAIVEINPLLADAIFDSGVNAGTGRAAEWLQRLLNVNNNRGALYPDIKVDGDIGPTTLRTLRNFFNARGTHGVRVLLSGFICLKGNHYIECSEKWEKNEKFTYGWLDHRIFQDMNMYMDLID